MIWRRKSWRGSRRIWPSGWHSFCAVVQAWLDLFATLYVDGINTLPGRVEKTVIRMHVADVWGKVPEANFGNPTDVVQYTQPDFTFTRVCKPRLAWLTCFRRQFCQKSVCFLTRGF